MTEQFAVRLIEAVEPMLRPEKAKQVAPRFGVGAEKVEKLLSRSPGIVTKPTSQAEAQRVATVFSSVGINVEVVNLNAKPQVAPVLSTPSVAAKPERVTKPAGENTDFGWSQAAPRLGQAAPGKPKVAASGIDGAVRESVIWTPVPAAEHPSRVAAAPADAAVADDVGVDDDASKAAKPKGRRFSLRWKLLLAAITPIIFLAATTLYIADSSINASTTRLLSSVGDNLAMTLASEMSNYIATNELDFSVPEHQSALNIYFSQRLGTLTSALHETAGVHLTDRGGTRQAGFWGPQLATSGVRRNTRGFPFNLFGPSEIKIEGNSSRLAEIQQRFRETTELAFANANYGDTAQQLAASLPARTVRFETFYMIGMPLANDVGTVHVVLTEENIAQTSGNVLRPIILAAAVAVVLGFVFTVILAVGLSRNIRRLASVADRISLGELDEPVEVKGNDEIRDVAEALERMRMSLQSAINRLRKRGRK